MVYAAEVACANYDGDIPKCNLCKFERADDLFTTCLIKRFRKQMGNHTEQHDIEEVGLTE